MSASSGIDVFSAALHRQLSHRSASRPRPPRARPALPCRRALPVCVGSLDEASGCAERVRPRRHLEHGLKHARLQLGLLQQVVAGNLGATTASLHRRDGPGRVGLPCAHPGSAAARGQASPPRVSWPPRRRTSRRPTPEVAWPDTLAVGSKPLGTEDGRRRAGAAHNRCIGLLQWAGSVWIAGMREEAAAPMLPERAGRPRSTADARPSARVRSRCPPAQHPRGRLCTHHFAGIRCAP